MIKLYKREGDAVVAYHEAWSDGDALVEHWGALGTRGETRNHPLEPGSKIEEELARILEPARGAGFAEIDLDDHIMLSIEYGIEEMGSTQDLDKRAALQDRMDETLGWTGLGSCDGGSIGSGTMEVACYVVEAELAKRVIAEDLAGTEFADYTRIYDEGG